MLTLLALVAVIAGLQIGALSGGGDMFGALSPGPISGAHQRFTTGDGCKDCHEAHGSGVAGWTRAILTRTEPTCITCHRFGPADDDRTFLAHNNCFVSAPGTCVSTPIAMTDRVACTGCHTEHLGTQADIRSVPDAECNVCHDRKIREFARDHPAFGERFPHDRRGAIRFDHVSHLDRHFQDGRYRDQAPATCLGCHQAEEANQVLTPGGFEQTCAACHRGDIARKPLLLVGLPEFVDNLADADAGLLSCGLSPDSAAALWTLVQAAAEGAAIDLPEPEDYEAVSLETLTAAAAYLLRVDDTDPDAYGAAAINLLMAMAADGRDPLADLLTARLGDPDATAALLLGLPGELVQTAACAWIANLEHDAPGAGTRAAGPRSGWYADPYTLGYRPVGHADPVARAWVEFALDAPATAADATDRDRAVTLRNRLASPSEGVGSCTKCHMVPAVPMPADPPGADQGAREAPGAAAMRQIQWRYQGRGEQGHFRFMHEPHLDIINVGKGCATCHEIDRSVDPGAAGRLDASLPIDSFRPIKQAICAQCHQEDGVRQDCGTCHRYHHDHEFRHEFQHEFQHEFRAPMADTIPADTIPAKAVSMPVTPPGTADLPVAAQ